MLVERVKKSHPFTVEDDVFLLNRHGEDNLMGDFNFSIFDMNFLRVSNRKITILLDQ